MPVLLNPGTVLRFNFAFVCLRVILKTGYGTRKKINKTNKKQKQ